MFDQKGNVFYAISHPQRRLILEALSVAEMPAMDLPVSLSPSSLSQHLSVLKQAGLVAERRHGRQRIYSLTPEALFEPFAWLSQYQMFWQAKMKKLGDYLEKKHGRRKKDH